MKSRKLRHSGVVVFALITLLNTPQCHAIEASNTKRARTTDGKPDYAKAARYYGFGDVSLWLKFLESEVAELLRSRITNDAYYCSPIQDGQLDVLAEEILGLLELSAAEWNYAKAIGKKGTDEAIETAAFIAFEAPKWVVLASVLSMEYAERTNYKGRDLDTLKRQLQQEEIKTMLRIFPHIPYASRLREGKSIRQEFSVHCVCAFGLAYRISTRKSKVQTTVALRVLDQRLRSAKGNESFLFQFEPNIKAPKYKRQAADLEKLISAIRSGGLAKIKEKVNSSLENFALAPLANEK